MSIENMPTADFQRHNDEPNRKPVSNRGEQVALLLLVSLVTFLFILSKPLRLEDWRIRKNG